MLEWNSKCRNRIISPSVFDIKQTNGEVTPFNINRYQLIRERNDLLSEHKRFVTGCLCGVWGSGLNTGPLYVRSIFGKSILNNLVCKSDGMENRFSLLCKCILIVTIDMYYQKYIERHTADTIVSWPNPKQWVIVHTSDLMMIRQSIYILSIITREWVNWKHTASHIV